MPNYQGSIVLELSKKLRLHFYYHNLKPLNITKAVHAIALYGY